MPDLLSGSCVVAQSGGPTSVINASIYGAIRAAIDSSLITGVYGAAHGITGVLSDKLYDLRLEDPAELELLKYTPSSALGSCRYKIADPDVNDKDYQRILEVFKRHNVRYFFYNGGNDSMDTCEKISRYMNKVGYECRIMGIPKTIDNDLFGTDHCPGFASAAKYIATSLMEVYLDSTVYDIGQITIVEIMGRNAGWLTAAASLACRDGIGPDLVYLPEVDFDLDSFILKVGHIYREKGNVLVAVSEGIHDSDGKLIAEYSAAGSGSKDAFGHTQLGGLAPRLAEIAKRETGAKVRGIELSLLQRCAAHCASLTDIEESVMAGRVAVESALTGETGKMVAFERFTENGSYACRTKLIPLSSVANFEKTVPLEWIVPSGDNVTQDFVNYALPLIQGETDRKVENSLPRFARLRKIVAE